MVKMLRLRKTKKGNYVFLMNEGFMEYFQSFLGHYPHLLTNLDKCVMQSIHDYCWAWNKMDDKMGGDLNGKGDFEEILNKELGWWAKEHGVDLKKITSLKCQNCDTVVDRLMILRFIEKKEEPTCPQCSNQDLNGKRMRLIPLNDVQDESITPTGEGSEMVKINFGNQIKSEKYGKS